MARADDSTHDVVTSDVNEDEEALGQHPPVTAKLSSASFRSATSYASFRSCRSIKSYNSRASFKSAVSRGNSWSSSVGAASFYNCDDSRDVDSSDGVRTGLVNQAYQDNVSFYSCNDVSPKNSIISGVVPRLRSVSDSVLHHNYATSDQDDDSLRGMKEEGAGAARRYLAGAMVMLAGVAAASSTYVQVLSPEMPPWVVLMYRSILQLMVSLPLLLVTKCNPFGAPGSRWRLLVTGLLSCFLTLTLYLSVTRAPVSVAATVMLLTPLTTNILSAILCKEHIGLFRLLCLCVYVSGTLLVTRPAPLFPAQSPGTPLHADLSQLNMFGQPVHFVREENDIVGGVVAALASVIIVSLILVINRQCKSTSFSVVLFWSSLGSLAMASIGLYTLSGHGDHGLNEVIRAGREIPDHMDENSLDNVTTTTTLDNTQISSSRIFEGTREWLVSTLIAVLGVFSTAILIKAVQYIHPGRASLLNTTQILTSYILVTSLSNVTQAGAGLEWLDLAGALLVLLTIIATLFEEKIIDTKRWKWF